MRVLLCVLLAGLAAAPAAAQQEPGPRQRVRLTLDDGARVVGTVASVGPDTLALRSPSGGASYAWPDLLRVEVSRGRRSFAAVGAAIGFGVGAVAGLVVAAGTCEDDDGFGCVATLGVGPLIGAGGGVALGSVAGGLIRRDRWATVR